MKPPNRRLLTLTLGANALFSGTWAVILLRFPHALAPQLGDMPVAGLQVVAVLLAAFVPLLGIALRQVSKAEPRAGVALGAIALDAAWVAGSAALLPVAFHRFTAWGLALFGGVALIVAALAILQWRGVGRMYAEPDRSLGTTHRIEITVDVGIPREAMWPVVADLEHIDQHLASLVDVRIDAAPGIGAVRTCSNAKGQRWSEEVTHWDPGRGFALRFLSDRDDFPYPLHPMRGGWELEAQGEDACRVTVWWSFTPRPTWLAPAMVPLLRSKIRADLHATVDSMARAARSQKTPARAPA